MGGKTIDDILSRLLSSFKRAPTEKYATEFRRYIISDLRLSTEDLELVCNQLVERCKTFPTKADVNTALEFIRKNKAKFRKITPKVETKVEKTKGELLGIPVAIESLCVRLDNGSVDRGLGWALRCTGLSENDLWAIYEARSEGRLHPLIDEYKKRRGIK